MSISICLLLSSLVTLALGFASGSGQCDLSAQGTINGMASRARSNARLTLTLSQSSAAPGERVQVRASVPATSGPIVGVLGTVVDATGNKVGKHVPGQGFAACKGDDNAITHSSSWAPANQISWNFVVPDVAGALAVRVVTLSGGSSSQTFSFKEATLNVIRAPAPPASTSSRTATTTTTTATTKAAATSTAAATTTRVVQATTSTKGITDTTRPTITATRSTTSTRPSTRTATTAVKDDVGLASSIVLSSAAAAIASIIALIN
jgi:hypothetical protein